MIGKTLSGSILIHYQIPSLSQRRRRTGSHMTQRATWEGDLAYYQWSMPFGCWRRRFGIAPVLIFLDFDKPFLLETDASGEGLGAMSSQKQDDGCYHPVAFGSHALTPSEQNYHSSKLEFLALKWSITKHFKEYLEYTPFIIWTDNNPLTDVMTMPNLDVTGHHWVGTLALYGLHPGIPKRVRKLGIWCSE